MLCSHFMCLLHADLASSYWWAKNHLVYPRPNLSYPLNEIVNLAEMKGGVKRARRQMIGFQEALEDSQLCDLGFKGPQYTWNNGRDGEAFTKERLDRATANAEWRSLFSAMEVTVLAKRSSDHHPIYVCLNERRGLVWRKKKEFRMEERWCAREDYKQVVKEVWTARRRVDDPWKNIRDNLERCQKVTKVWV